MSNFNKVKTFMETFGQEVKTKPSFSSDKINNLRYDLIKEELEELKEAMENKDLLEVADALTDILYVTYGAGHAFGIDLDKCFEEVQNSNMSKLDENDKPIYNESGKVMKSSKYFKPNLKKFI
jgi:predicted HAD superfamily Cof-like phosphohydrolase